MRLKNETGQRFGEGIYLDLKANKRYTIPAMASGDEVDLADIIPREIRSKNKEAPQRTELKNMQGVREPRKGPFSVEELPYSGFEFGPANRVFVAVDDVPVTSARLAVAGSTQQTFALIVVSMD